MSHRKMEVDNFVINIRSKNGAPNAHFFGVDQQKFNSFPKRTPQSKRSLNQNFTLFTKKVTGK